MILLRISLKFHHKIIIIILSIKNIYNCSLYRRLYSVISPPYFPSPGGLHLLPANLFAPPPLRRDLGSIRPFLKPWGSEKKIIIDDNYKKQIIRDKINKIKEEKCRYLMEIKIIDDQIKQVTNTQIAIYQFMRMR